MTQGGVISVVVPTLNAAAGLAACLEALKVDLVREVIVADAGSTDGTAGLAMQAGARVVGPLAPNRGAQIAAGRTAAEGAWLLLLHGDTRLEPGWERAARRHMAEHPGRAGWFAFALDDPAPIARVWEAGVALRSRLGLPYGDQGLLIPAALYDGVGGMRALPLMEDVDLVRRLGAGRLAPISARAVTSAARYRKAGYWRRSARNWLLLARWFAGGDPARLARRYD
jgi:rSAM/selenodomain-associated transferase 2